jgi:hypothetical protein
MVYSVTLPVRGSSLPTTAPPLPVYQMLPSRSSTSPCGPECAVFSGNSFTLPVFGSMRPSMLVIWPVYQSEPSRVASGSCGREPGVMPFSNTCIETCSGPGTITAGTLFFSGKCCTT